METENLSPPEAPSAYLDLLQRTLLGLNWDEGTRPIQTSFIRSRFKRLAVALASHVLRGYNVELTHRDPGWLAKRTRGIDWPNRAWSMIGVRRMDQLRVAAETAIREEIPGDFLEAGVWRGGAAILLRGVLLAEGDSKRVVWCADSFNGLPLPEHEADLGDPHHTYRELAISLEQVKENFRTFSLLDEQVKFLPGWFRDTLPAAPIERLAILRLDGDMYGSTRDALAALYHKVSPGGFIIVDEFGHPPCRQACLDCLTEHGHEPEIHEIDHTGVFWRKP